MTTASWPSIDHSLLSPSGRMSKRARTAALERERARLFGPDGLAPPTVQQSSERQKLLCRLRDLTALRNRGIHPRIFGRETAEIERRLANLPED